MDRQIFTDITEKLNLTSPALAEKDYYGVQLLKVIAGLQSDNWEFRFAGGTCLAKVHLKDLARMSEDIDMKFAAKLGIDQFSRDKKRKLKKELKASIIELIDKDDLFNVSDSRARNEGSNRVFTIDYPQDFAHAALRTKLKLEFTAVDKFWFPATVSSVGSIYARETRQEDEIDKISCDSLENILIEKLISLLRRTAKVARGASFEDDETLVRHIYDLFFIEKHGYDENKVIKHFSDVVEYDKQQFGNKHREFVDNPHAELNFGLQELLNNAMHRERYKNFLGPLVYHVNPPAWELGIENIEKLANKFISATCL